MKISSFNFNYFNNSQTQFQKTKINHSGCSKNFNINFTAKTPQTILAQLKEEDFPSSEIFQKVKNAYRADTAFSLYDAHIEHYSALMDCETLQEAKEIYPEFKDVIDAKDVNLSIAPYSIRQIARGERGIALEDLSLDCLKKYYGQAFCANHNQDKYYGCEAKAVKNILKTLNIPVMNSSYSNILYYQNPLVIQNASVKTKDFLRQHPEYREAHSLFMKQYMQTPEVKAKLASRVYDEEIRERLSKAHKRYHETHPERAIEHGRYMREYYAAHPELRENISTNQTEFHAQHREYDLLKSLVITKIFPDVQQGMQEIARDYKGIASIRTSREQGIPLTFKQDLYDRMYFARCEKEFPGMKKQMGQAYSALIKRFEISKDCDSEEKIREIEEYFSNDENVKDLMLEFRGFIVT